MLYCKWLCFADAGLEVEVKDPPKGMIPPGTQMVKPKTEPQPSKVSSLYPLIKNYGHECAHKKTQNILSPAVIIVFEMKIDLLKIQCIRFSCAPG